MVKKIIMLTATVALTGLMTACGAGTLYKDSIKFEKEGNYEAALTSIVQAVEKNPEKAEYYLQEGTILTLLERYEEAREAFSKAVVEKDLALTRKNSKKANYGIGVTYFREGAYAQATEYLTKALAEELLPEMNMDIRQYLADTYVVQQQYAEALPLCEEVVKEKAEDVLGQSRYATVLYELGKYAESAEAFDKVITLAPAEFDAYIGKYQSLAALQKTNEMALVLQQMEQLENPTAEESYFIAKAFFAAGQYDKAIAKLLKSVEAGYEDAHYYMAEIYKMQGNYSEAVYQFSEYIKTVGEEDSAAYNQLAVCLLEQGQYEEALAAVREGLLIRSAEFKPQLLRNEIVILENLGQYEEAYEKAKAYAADYPEDEEIQKEVRYLETRVRE